MFIYRSSSTNNPIKILNATNSLLKCFMFIDICFMITAITFILMVVSNQINPKEIAFGGILGVYATISSLVNSLANYGIRTWRRGFLVPWLAFHLLLFVFLMMRIAESIYAQSLQWQQVVLFAGAFIIYSCWRHMLKQHNMMTGPRPQVKEAICISMNIVWMDFEWTWLKDKEVNLISITLLQQ